MRVMVFVKATKSVEEKDVDFTTPENQKMMAEMGKFNEQLIAADILRDAAGLQRTAHGKRIAFNGADRTVIDGPFGITNELVSGFWIWDVKDMDEAVAWVKRCPNPMSGPSEIEIRPFYEFGNPIKE